MSLDQIQTEIAAKPQKVRMPNLYVWNERGGGSGKELKASQVQSNIVILSG